MKAWYLTGPNKMELFDDPEPVLQPGYLVAEILTIQASVTETIMIGMEDDGDGYITRMEKEGKFRLPGHEMVARVLEVNPDSRFKKGDRVSSLAKIPCGVCADCLNGAPYACKNIKWMGKTTDGITAERALIPEAGLVRVPDSLSNVEAANLQPLAECVNAFDATRFTLGESVAFYGAGVMGLNTMQIARAQGAGKIIVVDVKDESLATAKRLGADYVINGREQDPVKAIRELTGGRGADLVFEGAGGNPKKGLAGVTALWQAAESVRPEGELHLLAIYGSSVEFPIGEMRKHGKILSSPKFPTLVHMERAVSLLENKQVEIESLVKYRLEGIELIPEMFRITGDKGASKTLFPAQCSFKA